MLSPSRQKKPALGFTQNKQSHYKHCLLYLCAHAHDLALKILYLVTPNDCMEGLG